MKTALKSLLLLLAGCAGGPIKTVRLAADVDLAQKAVLTCVWVPDAKRELTCMTPADAMLILRPPEDPAPPRCVTTCGLRADVDEGACEALKTTEMRTLRAFVTEVPDFRPWQQACRYLDGWKVKVHPRDPSVDAKCGPGAWKNVDGGCVLGLTHSSTHTVEVENEAWAFNALSHELAHVLDEAFGTERGPKHCGWQARGIRRAIQDVIGEPEDVTDEDCP